MDEPDKAPPSAASVEGPATSGCELDPAIEALNLQETAKKAAYILKNAHPSVIFTSGRRDNAAQARAMASNVVLNRKWIQETYVPSEARDRCQECVNDNPDKHSQGALAAALNGVLDALTDPNLAQLSKHLSGDAFDIQPVTQGADAIKKTINSLPGLSKFLEREGGLLRWHVQF
jgi:hypothetical protein